ncbi:hypothetical protein V2J09_024039 [Rumex salicifolius]
MCRVYAACSEKSRILTDTFVSLKNITTSEKLKSHCMKWCLGKLHRYLDIEAGYDYAAQTVTLEIIHLDETKGVKFYRDNKRVEWPTRVSLWFSPYFDSLPVDVKVKASQARCRPITYGLTTSRSSCIATSLLTGFLLPRPPSGLLILALAAENARTRIEFRLMPLRIRIAIEDAPALRRYGSHSSHLYN